MKTILIVLFAFLTIQSFSQGEDIRKKHYNIKKSIALEGYDPVSYFDGKPLEGDSEIKYAYKGLTYLFSNTANQTRFKSSPEKYEPAYGGWCAYAMGESGEKVKIDPETYKIIDGKLYLFYNFWGNNTLEEWNKSEKKLKDAANHNWAIIAK
jgi:YHS domain-containing protein